MSLLSNKDFSIDIDFNNFLLIKVEDMMEFYGKFLRNEIRIQIDNFPFINNEFVISPMSKTIDLFNFTKSSIFSKYVGSQIDFSPDEMYKKEKVDFIDNIIKTNVENYELSYPEDMSKILNLFFTIDKEKYLTEKEFLNYCDIISKTSLRNPIVFFDIDWFNEEILTKICNKHIVVILITNKLNKWIDTIVKNSDNVYFFKNEIFYRPTKNEIDILDDDIEASKQYINL